MMNKINNILAIYSRARQKSKPSPVWYRKAYRYAKDLAMHTGHSIDVTVGVIACLSPGVRWSTNMQDAEAVLAGTPNYMPATYGHNVLKAYEVLACKTEREVVKVVRPRHKSGMKCHNFFLNIRHPLTSGPVTIDRHAISIALGRTLEHKEGMLTTNQYEVYADAYRQAASPTRLRPHELQAIVWEYWRTL